MAQAQLPASVPVPVMVKPLDKFKIGMNLSMFKISFRQYGRRLNFYPALIASESIRDTHIFNHQDISSFKKPIPSADNLEIFYQVALIIHRDKRAKNLLEPPLSQIRLRGVKTAPKNLLSATPG